MLQAGIATDVGSALAPRPAPKSTATWKVFAIDSGCLLSSLLRELRGEVLENVWQTASKQLQTSNGGKPRMETNHEWTTNGREFENGEFTMDSDDRGLRGCHG